MLPPSPSSTECYCPSPCSSPDKIPSSPLAAVSNQPFIITQLIEIRCFCHFDLLGAHFSITHDDQTNDFFVELLPSGDPSPVLAILFRFVDCLSADGAPLLQIFPSSYGHWRPSGSVHQCPPIGEGGPMRLHVHVHQQFYAVQLNGEAVETVGHKRPFSQLIWTTMTTSTEGHRETAYEDCSNNNNNSTECKQYMPCCA